MDKSAIDWELWKYSTQLKFCWAILGQYLFSISPKKAEKFQNVSMHWNTLKHWKYLFMKGVYRWRHEFGHMTFTVILSGAQLLIWNLKLHASYEVEVGSNNLVKGPEYVFRKSRMTKSWNPRSGTSREYNFIGPWGTLNIQLNLAESLAKCEF